MKSRLFVLLLGMAIGFALGFYRGKRLTDQDWAKRSLTGVAVDCYDKDGKLIPDEFAEFGAVRMSCGPGEIAKVHHAK